MTNKGKYYITTAIAYTSGKPHIGNSYEIVLADSIARFKRKDGYDVFFQTGTDEHGQKIELKAKEAGVTPKEFVDDVAGTIKDLWDLMDTSYDKFIRTTDDYHVKSVQKIFEKLYEKGLSSNSIRKYAVIVSGALHLAVLDEIIPYNIAKDGSIKIPKAKRFRGEVYDQTQAMELLEVAYKEPEPMRSAIILALCYGLRREEVCGLRWCDINFKKNEMYICNTVTQNGGTIFRDEDTKTEKSHRYLTLVDSTIPYLKELKAAQKKRGLILDKVCRWPDGKEVQPGYITHAFPKVLKRHGLKHIRFHDLRGTAASLMAQHAKPKQLQEFMGHNKISTTMEIYVKAFDDDRKAVAGFMNSILEKSPSCSENCSD